MGASGSYDDADEHDDEDGQGGSHTVKLAASEILTVAGQSGYHTSLIVDDKEYFFDSVGIMVAPPMWSHTVGRQNMPEDAEPLAQPEVTEFEPSHSSGKSMVEALRPYFQKGTYDIFHKNCNSFTDAALYYLTKQRLMAKYNRIERMVTATNPVSTSLLNTFFRKYVENCTGAQCNVDIYTPNPRAEGFAIDDVISQVEEEDEEESDASSDDEHWPPACTGPANRAMVRRR